MLDGKLPVHLQIDDESGISILKRFANLPERTSISVDWPIKGLWGNKSYGEWPLIVFY